MTDKEIAKVLHNIRIIYDTREQKNKHITDYFVENGIEHIRAKVESGDYTFCLPEYPELELDGAIIIERKNSWDEIAQNFTKGRARFAREFERVADNQQIHIMVENATWTKMNNESYRSQLPSKAFMASLFTWNARYGCPVWLCNKDQAGQIIYNIIYYGLREKLKEM